MEDLAQIYKALSDPTRLGILALLTRNKELCVCDLEAVLEITQSKASRHVSYLANAGLVKGKRCGQWMHYRIAPDMPDGPRALLRQLKRLLPEDQVQSLNEKLDVWLARKGVQQSCAAPAKRTAQRRVR